jgi:hypothetical protein
MAAKTLELIELAANRSWRNPIMLLLGDLNVDPLDARERRKGNRRQTRDSKHH